MKSATFPGTAQVLYGYDKDNRLVIEKDAYTPTNIRVYLWDDLGQIILVKRANQYYSYAYDAFKRIQFEEELEMLETCGTAVAISDYNAYGKILSENGTSHTPFRYACYYYDTDTDLYYLQNRYYAADKARFMTEDPYWNVSNMLYGKFTSAVERRVYYPAVVQSGNRYVYAGGNPVRFTDPNGLEKIVISGGNDGIENFQYNFIETAIKQINDWKAMSSDESIMWIVANWNYSEQDTGNFSSVAENLGVDYMLIDTKIELFDYINNKKGNRSDDLISEMVFFAHGTAFDNLTFVNPGHEDDYAIALGLGKESNNKLNIFGSNISAISSDAFAENNVTLFYTCRTGAEFKGTIFAQKWANLTLGNVQAAVEKTDYHNIYPDERNFVEKLLLVKAEREEARAEFGFSKDGCKNYPEILHNGKWITFSKKPENKRQVLRFKDILSKEK